MNEIFEKNVCSGNVDAVRDCIVHYGELALKGRNQGLFRRALVENIRQVFHEIGPCHINLLPGRIWIAFKMPVGRKELSHRLSHVTGVSWFAPTVRLEPNLDALKACLREILPTLTPGSFAVRAKRGEEHFPLSGQTVNEQIGGFIKEWTDWKVDLENPDRTFSIELLIEHIFLHWEKERGIGGLPSGTGGTVLTLLSGGIDSPVAAFRLIRRGCKSIFLHFHSSPFTNAASQEKVWELAEILGRFQGGGELVSVPFGALQQEIIAKTPERFRVLFYRRFMFRIAEAIAKQKGALGLVTGESLGQVASQTLKNLSVIESVQDLPVLRPLIGMDKQEIVDEARRMGTYDISIRPHEDCCSFMLPKSPSTGAGSATLEILEKELDIERMVQEGVSKAQILPVQVRF